MATSEECIMKASKASAADVNRMSLVDELLNTRSVKVLAGTSTYNYISYAERTLPDLLALKTEVMQQFYDFLGMVENGLQVVEQGLDAILQPRAWQAFMQNASLAGELMEPPCMDMATCYGGVLAATWADLESSTPVLNEQPPSIVLLNGIKQSIRQYKVSTSGVLCDDAANLRDAERSYLSMFKAAMTAMLNVTSDLSVEVLMRHGPGILSRTLANYAGLSLLQGLEEPAYALKDAVQLLADACADAVEEYNQRYKKGMYKIATVQGGVPSQFCPDGQ
eukprot:gene1207-1544_t